MNKNTIQEWMQGLQNRICGAIENTDGQGTFHEDKWQRPKGGGGITRVITNGNIIEKGGVNFSAVSGVTPHKIITALNMEQSDFFATGVSIVMHPNSPMVPIIHMNVRYFEMNNGMRWFGGGIDLTPHYVNEDDAKFFHSKLKYTCDQHDVSYYPDFKKWADDYFFIKHRNEMRGIGGIFFDHLTNTPDITLENRWNFVKDIGNQFAPIYTSLISKNKNLPFGKKEKEWQLIRRGRYAEFNLVWDKGTKFGLDTNGRTESILMSLPPQAHWHYNHQPNPKSKEQTTLNLLQKGIDWT